MEAGEPLQKKPRIDSEDQQVPLPGAADGFGGSSSLPDLGQQRSWVFAPQYGDKQLPGQPKSTGNASTTGKNAPDGLQPGGGVGAAGAGAENGLSTTQEAKEVIRRPPVRVGGSQYEAPADLEGSRPSDAKGGEALGAYVDRETSLMDMEKRGEIAFHYITNDDSPKSLIWLMGLKNIFSKQLPNMPRTYICRLVLDRRHRSVVLVRRDDTVLGGITYRVFHKQRVGEIAFCAISSTEQVKGFGTRLMNHTKENARTQDNLSYFLTYADNNAVGYFLKQGFTKEVTLHKEEWVGFIKDYDGGTLMEFRLHPKVPYTSFPDMVKAQRKHLDEVVAELSNSHIVHPGLQHPTLPNGQRCRIHAKDIPGVLEAGWSPDAKEQAYRIRTRNGMFEAVSAATLQQLMQEGLSMMMKQDDMWPFREPVNGEEVLDYYDVVKDPIDLSLIQQRLHSQQYYVTLEMFVHDFRRMFQNARIYNAADTVYFKLANKMDQLFQQWVDEHLLFMK